MKVIYVSCENSFFWANGNYKIDLDKNCQCDFHKN